MQLNHSLVTVGTVAAITFSGFSSAQPDDHGSFSEVSVGFERISYSEELGDVAGMGKLTQSIAVINPAIRQLSYTGINQQWGIYIQSASTLATDIETEYWEIGEFGRVQQNAFKTKANELGFKLAYHQTSQLQWLMGGRFYTNSFTRSNFAFVDPGASRFDQALIDLPRNEGDDVPRFNLPGQNVTDADTPQSNNPDYLVPVISVSEDHMGVILLAGIRYDTQFGAEKNSSWSWFSEAELSVDAYSQTQNTQFETLTLKDYFNGYGLSGKLGVRYNLLEHIAVLASVDGYVKQRDEIISHLSSGRRIRVPEVTYSNLAFTIGLQWRY
ncbi:hypothetical protein BOO91_13975 [Vibrio navarrensis]|uniref:hypothetical protein n=1 Tax=Vibrio TaxID=662 RepID=UPI00061FC5A6|nr:MULTISPECIES: hypothetical protein [Vibrio]KJR21263.1 hypothetical protein UF06_20605 [Vibrio sp. S234-5]MBE3657351.1 hypothetical protein [Vibrio navarrensis]MBE3662038.1 hypothetical protein [Vibrio navarrensis]MBE4603861.1 hypothetical protein [Vibrio navarrensis]MBH9741808.1 hypothetical protein [Vibrio navarrensis]